METLRNGDNPKFIKAMGNHYYRRFDTALDEYRAELSLLQKLDPEMITDWRDGEPQTVAERIVDVEFFIAFEEDSHR